MKTMIRLTVCLMFFHSMMANCQSKMVKIIGGEYIPLYGANNQKVSIDDFYMDVYPVTNQEFLEFVKKYPEWKRSKVLKLFVDANYLRNWKSDTLLNATQNLKSPITNISWFAAKNYCESQNKRLPTIDEWEYVAMSDEKIPDARTLKTYNEFILGWYEKPKTNVQTIGSTFQNYWKVYDMHGLVWEWTSDFNAVLLSGESRKDGANDSNQFCGSAAINATDLMNYAAFMRYAIRGSLKAKYSMKNLGFRCVKD